jgi:hypothetical protein
MHKFKKKKLCMFYSFDCSVILLLPVVSKKIAFIWPCGFKDWSHLTQWLQRVVSFDPVVSKKIGLNWPSGLKEDWFHLTQQFQRRFVSFDIVVWKKIGFIWPSGFNWPSHFYVEDCTCQFIITVQSQYYSVNDIKHKYPLGSLYIYLIFSPILFR